MLVSDTSNTPKDDPAVGAAATGSAGSPIVQIVHVERVDDELVEAFQRLIPQLSSSSPPPGPEHLAAIVDSPDTVLFVARVDGRILGSLTLAFYRIPSGTKAWIEDAGVDADARGHGVGEILNRARGREMVTSYILGFFMDGIYQLVVLYMMGSEIPLEGEARARFLSLAAKLKLLVLQAPRRDELGAAQAAA